MSNLGAAQARIQQAETHLQAAWQEARSGWRDELGEQFERTYWEPWAAQLPQLRAALDELAQALSTALAQLN